MSHGRKVFFQYIHVDDIVYILRKETNGLPQEYDRRLMRPSD